MVLWPYMMRNNIEHLSGEHYQEARCLQFRESDKQYESGQKGTDSNLRSLGGELKKHLKLIEASNRYTGFNKFNSWFPHLRRLADTLTREGPYASPAQIARYVANAKVCWKDHEM